MPPAKPNPFSKILAKVNSAPAAQQPGRSEANAPSTQLRNYAQLRNQLPLETYLEILHVIAVHGFRPALDNRGRLLDVNSQPCMHSGLPPAPATTEDGDKALATIKEQTDVLFKLVNKSMPDAKHDTASSDAADARREMQIANTDFDELDEADLIRIAQDESTEPDANDPE